jgi:ABC-type phosphate transport system ATPase subunit
MAKVGAQRAAELTGKSKSTIQRAMKSGKISFELDHNNRRVIDVAELERAFGLVPQNNSSIGNTIENELQKAKDMLETERLKMRIKFLEEQLDLAKEQIDDLKDQREEWQKQAQQVLLTSQYSQKSL